MTHWLVGEQWGKERERNLREECGTGKPENNLLLLAQSPSLLSLAMFRRAASATNLARWTWNLLAVQVGELAEVTLLCS